MVIGAYLGSKILGEAYGRYRAIGSGFIVIGVAVLTLP